jgi:hypothetical protein
VARNAKRTSQCQRRQAAYATNEARKSICHYRHLQSSRCPAASKLHFFRTPFIRPIFSELRGAVRQHAFGWPALFPVRYLWCREPALLRWRAVHGRRGRAPKTPTLLDVLWVRGRLKLQNHERSLPRVLDSKLRVTASPTRVSLGVASCQSEILSLKKAVWRLWLVSKSRTKSSAEGCEQLLRRAASVARPPSSPSHARTALSRTICNRI